MLERKIMFTPAYDKRDPNPSKNYGIHGVEMRWLVTGPKGAIQFVLSTNWHLKAVQEELDERLDRRFPHLSCHPMPMDLGYHSPVPMYEGQTCIEKECEFLGGKPCYYDGSTLNAEKPYWILVEKGGDALWEYLEGYYRYRFEEVSDAE